MSASGVRPGALAALAVTVTVLLAGAPQRARAQGGEAALDTVVTHFAASWRGGDVEAVAGRLAEEGILLYLPDAMHPVLSHRLARAALADLHDRAGRGEVAIRQSRLLGGSPARAFVEMTWTPMPPGVSEALEYTVFAGLEERAGRWWVVEVRVLPPVDRGGAEEAAGPGPGAVEESPNRKVP